MRGRKGFTLVELLVVMAILFMVLTSAFSLFLDLLGTYKQQAKLAESGVERMIGLDLLRQDIERAGYGLPWRFPSGFSYSEAASGTLNDAPSNPPRGVVSANNTGLNGSDRLVVKSAAVGIDPLCRRWTLLSSTGTPRTWSPASENLAAGDRVIVIDPGSSEDSKRTLVVSGGSFHAAYPPGSGFAPSVSGETRVVYGIEDAASLRMPFNRAEYFIDNTGVPAHCASGTGVLVKRLVSHSDGSLGPAFPLLDCVAGMEVEYGRDADDDGAVDAVVYDDVSTLDAPAVRGQVREVRVYLLAQEGQRDADYTHPVNPVNLRGQNIAVDAHYRWRVHELVVKTLNLRY